MSDDVVEVLRGLGRNWQVLLIASLPGSVLRIWAVLDSDRLSAWAVASATQELSALAALLLWGADHPAVTLLTFPLLAIAALVALDWRDAHSADGAVPGRRDGAPADAPRPFERLSPAARDLLAAASSGGALRVEWRRAGVSVVATAATDLPWDMRREFHDDARPELAERYRAALGELAQGGFVEQWAGGYRLTALGRTAATWVARQELERLASRRRHLDESERALLRLIADSQHRHKVGKIVLERDGAALSAVHGNGQIVFIPGVQPAAAALPDVPADARAARFEQLVQTIPNDFLELLPGQLSGNPFLVRITDAGVQYLRHAAAVHSDCAA